MGSPIEELTRTFYAWEGRGRGWQVAPYPVLLEPPFCPFPGHRLLPQAADDARRETRLSRLADCFFARTPEAPRHEVPESTPEPEPEVFLGDAPLQEIAVILPEKVPVSPLLSEELLLALSSCAYPLSFEILGASDALSVGFTVRLPDRDRVISQLRAFFPDAVVIEGEARLRPAWSASRGEGVILEFGLAREFMLPLKTPRDFRPDPLLPLFAALSEVREGELALLQVLFQPVSNLWAESILHAVHTERGEPFFLDCPELTSLAKEKVSRPLYAAVVRLAVKARDGERTWALMRSAGGAFVSFIHWNELIPLANEEAIDLEADLLSRTTHRTGMLLSSGELAALVHLPHESVRLAKLHRQVRRTKAPPLLFGGEGVLLGTNVHEGRAVEVRLPPDLRMRHLYVLGASGSGKSTLLARMILEDVARGEGVAVLDPHGDLVDEILARVPEERESDLILFDPADEEVSLGWNMLHARSEIEKTLLSSDLVGVFRRLSTSWGDQMNSVLANAILAFLESRAGGTLLDLRRFLVDREFRAEFLRTVEDSEVLYYWQKEFPLLVGKPQGPILTRLDTFLRPKLVRRVVVEREHRLDFREIVDQGRVFLGKLSQGAIGEENAALLGSLIVSAFHQAAISRADLAPHARRRFFLYLDEFHEFATPSMAALLTGARKYRLGLTLAHQELRQLEMKNREVASALLGNAATRVIFRVGEDDARDLERGFSSFTSADLLNLGVGEAIARVERAEHDFNLRTAPLPDLGAEAATARREALREMTCKRFPRSAEKEPSRMEPAPPSSAFEREAPQPQASPPPAVPPPPKRTMRPAEPPPMGRGGPEHRYLQELVKRWGEAKGYRVRIEEPILDGKGSVDVTLEREGSRLACEISVTTTVEQEVGNVMKCLAAGFPQVALVSLKKAQLARVRAALAQKVAPEDLDRVLFFAPEELSFYLEAQGVPPPSEEIVGGYRVKVDYEAPDEVAKASRARAIGDLIAQRMKEKKR